MLQNINQRLSKILEEKLKVEKYERDLAWVNRELDKKTPALAQLLKQLEKEQIDVKKLEGSSLRSLLLTFFGNLEEKIDQERKEMLAAQVKYREVKHQVDTLKREREEINNFLLKSQDIHQQYQNTLAEKENFLNQTNQVISNRLITLSEEIEILKDQNKEVQEARNAAKEAQTALKNVVLSLNSAKNWGTYDMLGGGFISTAIKHAKIDEAKAEIEFLQTKFSRLKRELDDIKQTVSINIRIEGFDTFADYFFDGLLWDWVVQSKINEALDQAKDSDKKINDLLNNLNSAFNKLRAEIITLETERENLIRDV